MTAVPIVVVSNYRAEADRSRGVATLKHAIATTFNVLFFGSDLSIGRGLSDAL